MNKELVEKIHKAVLQMMEDVSFNKVGHIYTRKSDGVWLQGVSTVSSIIPKDWLAAWGAKEAVKALGYSDYVGDVKKANQVLQKIWGLQSDLTTDGKGIKKNAVEKYIAILKEAKGASRRKSKEALVDGKAGHDWLEIWVKAKIRNTELPKIPDGMLKRPLTQFIEWAERDVDYWILSEARVASPDEEYAGTLDGLAMMKTGKLALTDFKFASHISEDYYLQTAGYQNCLEKYGIPIDQRIIVQLPKTLLIESWDKKTRTYSKVENKIEVVIVKTDYKMDRDVFLHCLPIKKWINIMKNK
jgi:hypothetical protein